MIVDFLKRFYLFTFRERGRDGEREGETSKCERHMDWWPLTSPQLGTWPATQACALARDQTSDLSVCRLALSPLNHTSQGKILCTYIYKIIDNYAKMENIFNKCNILIFKR